MKKIQFDIRYQPEIEAGKYKVVTRDDRPVRIVCWDFLSEKPLIGVIGGGFNDGEVIATYSNMGRVYSVLNDSADLFLVPAEPELTPFEDAIRLLAEEAVKEAHLHPERTSEDFAKKNAMKILEVAFKNIPRWKKCVKPGRFHTFGFGIGRDKDDGEVIFKNGWEISVRELIDNLPKEEKI